MATYTLHTSESTLFHFSFFFYNFAAAYTEVGDGVRAAFET